LIELKRKMMKEDIPLQSNICKNFPSSSSSEHLKATPEIEAFKQIRQQTAHPEENVHENEQLHHTRPQKHTCVSLMPGPSVNKTTRWKPFIGRFRYDFLYSKTGTSTSTK
jgi:hypothetical protein